MTLTHKPDDSESVPAYENCTFYVNDFKSRALQRDEHTTQSDENESIILPHYLVVTNAKIVTESTNEQ